jgi:hypothetical protein
MNFVPTYFPRHTPENLQNQANHTVDTFKLKKIQKAAKDEVKLLEASDEELPESIKTVINKFNSLANEIDNKISSKSPSIAFKKIDQGFFSNIVREIEKLIKKLFSNYDETAEVHGITLKKVNSIIGEYQAISKEDLEELHSLLTEPLILENFQALSTSGQSPIDVLENLLTQLEIIRTKQIQKLQQCENYLQDNESIIVNKTDYIIIDVFTDIQQLHSVLLQIIGEKNNKSLVARSEKAAKIISALRDSALPRNTQMFNDNIYPPTLIQTVEDIKKVEKLEESIKFSPTVSRRIKASGWYVKPDLHKNYYAKADWKSISINKKEKTFVRGFRRIVLQDENGHRVESGASLDLSPLGIQFSKKQEALIFHYIAQYVKDGYIYTKDENGDIRKLDGSIDENLNERLNQIIEKIGLDENQKTQFIDIVNEFNTKLSNAIVLAKISFGHKQAPTTNQEI